MRVTSALLLALPALALAEDQIPLQDKVKSWFGKLTDAVSSAVPAAVPSAPVEATAAKVAEHVQHHLTLENWKDVLTKDSTASAPTTQDWVVYINGGNLTCFGHCGNATKAWNVCIRPETPLSSNRKLTGHQETVALLSAKPKAPKFATIDCDEEPILCNSWSVGPPSIYYFNIPKPLADQSAPAPTVRYIPLRRNATTVETLKALIVDKEYEKTAPYEGPWHPFNGVLAQYNLAVPVGYVLWGFNKMPSWLPMILISFLSRSFM